MPESPSSEAWELLSRVIRESASSIDVLLRLCNGDRLTAVEVKEAMGEVSQQLADQGVLILPRYGTAYINDYWQKWILELLNPVLPKDEDSAIIRLCSFLNTPIGQTYLDQLQELIYQSGELNSVVVTDRELIAALDRFGLLYTEASGTKRMWGQTRRVLMAKLLDFDVVPQAVEQERQLAAAES